MTAKENGQHLVSVTVCHKYEVEKACIYCTVYIVCTCTSVLSISMCTKPASAHWLIKLVVSEVFCVFVCVCVHVLLVLCSVCTQQARCSWSVWILVVLCTVMLGPARANVSPRAFSHSGLAVWHQKVLGLRGYVTRSRGLAANLLVMVAQCSIFHHQPFPSRSLIFTIPLTNPVFFSAVRKTCAL